MAGFLISAKDQVVVDASMFDRRINFQAYTDVADSAGTGIVRTWANVLSSWAHMEAYKGRQYWEADQDYAHAYERIVVRYRKNFNITTSMRITFKSRILYIRWVGVPNEANRVIELLVDELQAKGSVA